MADKDPKTKTTNLFGTVVAVVLTAIVVNLLIGIGIEIGERRRHIAEQARPDSNVPTGTPNQSSKAERNRQIVRDAFGDK